MMKKLEIIIRIIKIKKQLLKEAVLTQKIVVRLSKSVYRFYEPLIFFDVDVCNKQTYYRNKWKYWLNTLLRNLNSSG